MKEWMKDPFSRYHWIGTELVFAMILGREKERILVGTKAGIAAHWAAKKEIPSGVELPRDDGRESWAGAMMSMWTGMTRTLLDTMTLGLHEQAGEEREEGEIPLVCDRTFELGHFLLAFEKDPHREWEQAVERLQAALKRRGRAALAEEERARTFLLEKWRSKDPVCQFASLKIWQDYCAVRRVKTVGEQALIPYEAKELPGMIEQFSRSAKKLVDAFRQNPGAEPSVITRVLERNDPILRLPSMGKIMEDELRVWAVDGMDFGCVLLNGSFYPLKLHYRLKMNEYGVKFSRCIVCGRVFATDTRKRETCGSACAKLRKETTTGRYREKNRDDVIELMRNRAYQHWYNRIRKAKQIHDFPARQLEELEAAFAVFKGELRANKKKAVEKKIFPADFNDWLVEQEELASRLMGKYEQRCRR